MERPQKVVAYIVRNDRLVVLAHADDDTWDQSGLQVPAGTIRPAETPQAAVLRECREETGLTDLHIEQFLGVGEYDMRPYRDEVQVRHYFHLSCGQDPLAEQWYVNEQGDGDPIRFRLYWLSLVRAHALAVGQAALLGRLLTNRRRYEPQPETESTYRIGERIRPG